MTEGKAETTETTEKSPGDLAREKVAPQGYEWLTNYDREKPPNPDRSKWLADLQKQDPTIVDLQMALPAFDEEDNPFSSLGPGYRGYSEPPLMVAAYIKRRSPAVSADPAIKPLFRQNPRAALHSRGPTIEKSR